MTTITGTAHNRVDVGELFRRAYAEFADRVSRVGDRWAAATPCPAWDVRGLVRHVVEEQRWAVPLLSGQTISQVGDRFRGDLLGADPAGTEAEAGAGALAAVEVDGALERIVHLSFGDVTGREYVLQLAADHLVHAWDLACALGEDVVLDPWVVARVREWFGGAESDYRGAGLIGARAMLPTAPSAQDELLVMFGRDPALAAVARFNAGFAGKDVDAVMAAMTSDCVFEDTAPPDGRRHVGQQAVRAAWVELFAGSPYGRFTTEELSAAGDRVLTRWRYDWGTGHVRGVDLFTVRGGLVAEKLAYVKG